MNNLGLSNNNGMQGTTLTVVEGSFRLRVPEGTAKSIQRTNKKGDKINELSFTNLTGYITGMSFEETEWGKMLHINFEADKNYKLTLGYADGLASNLYKILPNIKPEYPVSISLTRKPDDKGVFRTSMFVNQNGSPCKWFWTKSNPGKMPPFEQITVKGKLTWDNSKQIDFLINSSVLPFVDKLKTVERKTLIEEMQEVEVHNPYVDANLNGEVENIPF